MFLKRLGGLGLIALRRLDRIRVSFPRAVAGFASGNVILAGYGYFCVDRFFILDEFRLMARSALVNAGVIGRIAFEKPRGYRRALKRFGHLPGWRRICQ